MKKEVEKKGALAPIAVSQINSVTKTQLDAWRTDALKKATPVARRWAHYLMQKEHQSFADFEEMFMNIIFIENDLYAGLKRNLCNHINRHGLGARGLEFMRLFEEVQDFNFHQYENVLRRIRKSFAHNSRAIDVLKKQIETTRDYALKDKYELQLNNLQRDADDFEYLISKINEFLKKIRDLSNRGYDLLMSGEAPSLNAWKNQAVLNDRLFEENKQFLKQTLHHIETLLDSHCRLGVAEIRLLLYHKDGCRRQKLQKMVEDDIITIFNQLQSEDERQQIYPKICDFVSEIVPAVGYISPLMVSFIFDRGFVSAISRDLLLKIKPIICKLNMTPLLETPLKKYLQTTLLHLRNGDLTETDEYILELTQAYLPKALSDEAINAWADLKKSSCF